MKLKKYLSKSSNLFAENRLLKFVVVVLSISTILCMVLALKATRSQRTIIIPAGFDTKIVATGNTLNDDYVKLYTRYIMNLLLNYHPETISGNYDELLTSTTSEYFPILKKILDEKIEETSTLQASSVFYPQRIDINQETSEIKVKGLLVVHSYSTPVESEDQEYTIRYQISNGRFLINGLGKQDTN